MAICPGIYNLAQARDGWLARIRIPGGILDQAAALAIAGAAQDLGNGIIDLTNRANLQVRGLAEDAGALLGNRLARDGIDVGTAARDRLRNLTASPLAGLDPLELYPAARLVRELDDAFQTAEGLDGLSVKFAIVVDGGCRAGVSAVPHDLGFIAERGAAGGAVFRLSFGGRRSSAICAPAVVARIALDLAQAVARLARATDAKRGCRMTDLISLAGYDGVLDRIAGLAHQADLPSGSDDPERHTGGLVGDLSVRLSGVDAIGLSVPVARFSAETLAFLAGLAATYGDGQIRLTPWQGVVLAGLDAAARDEVLTVAAAAGFGVAPIEGLVRVVACAGATGCLRTTADTKFDGAVLARDLMQLPLAQRLARNAAIEGAPVVLHLSGCHRGCAHPGRAAVLALADPRRGTYGVFANAAAGNQHELKGTGRQSEVPLDTPGDDLIDAVVSVLAPPDDDVGPRFEQTCREVDEHA